MIKNEHNTLELFLEHHDEDLRKILKRRFSRYLQKHPLDDVVQDIYCLLARRRLIEAWDPTRGMSLATYIYMLVDSHLSAYNPKYRGKTRDASDHTLHLEMSELDKEKKGISLDTLLLPVQTIKGNATFNKILTGEIKERLKKYNTGKPLPDGKRRSIYRLYELLLEDWLPAEIAAYFGVTDQAVNLMKIKLFKIIRKIA